MYTHYRAAPHTHTPYYKSVIRCNPCLLANRDVPFEPLLGHLLQIIERPLTLTGDLLPHVEAHRDLVLLSPRPGVSPDYFWFIV